MQENHRNTPLKGERTINLTRLLRALWKRAWIIVLVTVLVAIVTFICSKQFIDPTYQSYFTAYVNNRQDGQGSTTSSDITASKNLTYLYQEIICSRSVLTDAASACGMEASYGKLQGNVTTSIAQNAALITVKVRASSPEEAQKLANAIAQAAPVHVARVVEGSSMRIVDYPVLPTAPAAPNSSRHALLGAVMAFVMMAAAVVLVEVINDRVDSPAEIEERYGIAVIGTIPDIAHADKGTYANAANKSGRK